MVGRLQSPVLLVQTEAANFLLTVERVQRNPPWTVLPCCMKFAKQTCKGKSVQYFFVWNHSIDSSIRAATRQKIRTVSKPKKLKIKLQLSKQNLSGQNSIQFAGLFSIFNQLVLYLHRKDVRLCPWTLSEPAI